MLRESIGKVQSLNIPKSSPKALCAWCSMSADQATDELHLWLWEYTDEIGKRRRSTWRMTEAEAAHYKDAVKVEGSLELRTPLGNTGDWQKRDGRS